MPNHPSKHIDTFENQHPKRDYVVECVTDEFTCLCPMTGQPDFAQIRVRYAPAKLCFELRSFKLYLWSYRQEGHFHEDVTNRILNDLVATISPKWMQLEARFNVRGGIATTVTVSHGTLPPNC